MRRRRSRRRGSRPLVPALVLVASVLLVVAAVFGSAGMGTASFSTGELTRSSAVNVTDDATAAHELSIADSVAPNATGELVTVTNHLGQDVTVTVTLRADSEAVGHLVVDDATVDDATVGNSTSFSLARGASQTVELNISGDGSLPTETVYFHVNASGATIDVTSPDRSVPVKR